MRGAAWVLVAAAAGAATARAQPGPVAPVGGPSEWGAASDPGEPPPEPAARPLDLLGPPVKAEPDRRPDREPPPPAGSIEPAGRTVADPAPARRAGLGPPESGGRPVAPRAVDPAGRSAPAAPDTDPVNDLLAGRSSTRRTRDRGGDLPGRASGKFGDRFGEAVDGALGERREWFRSDHAFDGFISPVTNPFLFEDPRSLTEARPVFIYQNVPGRQPDFRGGNIFFFGTQARVAVTDRLSFVLHKLGGISVNSGGGSSVPNETGFAELWLGPKYTFLRGEDTGSLLAGGLQFQIPVGSRPAFQDTGSLSVVPYLTYGQNFLRDFRYGSFNGLVGTGYAFSGGSDRSDYYYLSAHLDLDVCNNHKFYPLTELNWLIYTTNGRSRPIGVEGRDLINFGGQSKGAGLLTWAVGARYKFSEAAQVGGAFEIPFAGPRDLFRYRFTLDFILRY